MFSGKADTKPQSCIIGRFRKDTCLIVRCIRTDIVIQSHRYGLVGYEVMFLCVMGQVRLLTCGSGSQYIEMLRRFAWHAAA
jgi:hypothetical protein